MSSCGDAVPSPGLRRSPSQRVVLLLRRAERDNPRHHRPRRLVQALVVLGAARCSAPRAGTTPVVNRAAANAAQHLAQLRAILARTLGLEPAPYRAAHQPRRLRLHRDGVARCLKLETGEREALARAAGSRAGMSPQTCFGCGRREPGGEPLEGPDPWRQRTRARTATYASHLNASDSSPRAASGPPTSRGPAAESRRRRSQPTPRLGDGAARRPETAPRLAPAGEASSILRRRPRPTCRRRWPQGPRAVATRRRSSIQVAFKRREVARAWPKAAPAGRGGLRTHGRVRRPSPPRSSSWRRSLAHHEPSE